MRWQPNFTIQQQEQDQNKKAEAIHQAIDDLTAPRHPISDTSQFIVTSTTIDTQKIIDPRFKERWENEIMSIDKLAPLSNIDLTDQLLTRLIWMDVVFARRMGMTERAQRKTLEILRLYNESRGRDGFFQRAMITQRQELLARQQQEEQQRKSWLSRFRHKTNPQEQQMIQGGTPQ
jgi:hypothetical protein